MKNFLKKNLAVILGATILAGFVAMINGGEVVRAGSPCPVEDWSKEVKKETLEQLSLEDLDICYEKLNSALLQEVEACASGTCDPEKQEMISKNEDTLIEQIATKSATAPINDYVKHNLNISDIATNLCYDPENPEEKHLKYATIIEEPIESDLSDTTNFRNCVRNTFCIDREDKPGTECVTFLRAAGPGSCSQGAINYAKEPANKASIYCQQVQLIMSESGTDLIFIYVGGIYRWAASIIGMIAVLIMVISGIQISAAAGDQQAVTNAKNRIVQSLGGLALLFLSGIVLYTINPTFFTAG
jgi:hypothetical protein